jgi:16S rRNA (guanine1207-N2)-methyltransferase
MPAIDILNQVSLFTENFSGSDIRFFSKAGVPSWDNISPSQRLIGENIPLESGASVLILGCGHGAHALSLATKYHQTQITITDTNGIALSLIEKSIVNSDIPNLTISRELSLYPSKKETFDYVIIDLPKGRKISRRWLLEAYLTLNPEGELFLAGANDQGIQSAAQDGAEIFTHHSVIALKKGNRLLRFTAKKNQSSLPPWCNSQGILPGTWMEFSFSFLEEKYIVKTLPGVFASDGLDQGTAFLLEHIEFTKEGNILDFGCGCGIIGLMIAKNSQAWIDMTDINRYALAVTTENIHRLGLSNCQAFFSDGLEAIPDKKYDQIISNPPFHSGNAIDYSMTNSLITESFRVLNRSGEICLVANKFIRYDRLLGKYFPNIRSLASNRYYTIWVASKS